MILYDLPPGHDEGPGQQVLPIQAGLLSQGIVPAHQHPPHLLTGQAEKVVFGHLYRFHQDAEVQLSLVQFLPDIVPDAAIKIILYLGILSGETLQSLGQHPGGPCLYTSDGHCAAQQVIQVRHVPKGLFHQCDDLLRPLLEQHPRLGQRHLALTSNHQRRAHILLQIHQLAADGGLGNVELFRGAGDIPVFCYRQKILQQSNIHIVHPFPY